VVFFVVDGFFTAAVFFVVAVFFVAAGFFVVVCAFFASEVYFFAVVPVVFGREVVPPDDFFSDTALGEVFFAVAEVAFGLVVEDFFDVGLVVFVAGLVFCIW
jgi:hypothetical protein